MANLYYESISKKQAGVIFSANKQGLIKMNDLQVKYMYNHFVELRSYNNDNNYQDILNNMRNAVQAIFDKDYKKAQEEIEHAFSKLLRGYDSKEIKAMKEVA